MRRLRTKHVWLLIALLALAIAGSAWFALRPGHKEWENDGSYAGPLTRNTLPYDPSKTTTPPRV
jgi:cbb3-type cytochrome oxidase subunit 3